MSHFGKNKKKGKQAVYIAKKSVLKPGLVF